MTDRAKILIVDDDEGIRNQLKWALVDDYIVETAADASQAQRLMKSLNPDLVTLDIALSPFAGDPDGIDLLAEMIRTTSGVKVIMITGLEDKQKALDAVRLGAYDFYQKPVNIEEIKIIISRALWMQQLERENRRLAQQLSDIHAYENIIGNHPLMLEVFGMIDSVAPVDIMVLITGESGTGKELVARAIHARSQRSNKPFAAINCGAIPASLLESELFGHEKGSFTGAYTKKIGRFESANGGTIFLDEIGEMPAELQVKLLRFLEDHSIDRIGGKTPIELDVRVVAATNKNLQEAVAAGAFRDDLFFRLSVININLPPLRERGEDRLLLLKFFLNKYMQEYSREGLHFARETIQAVEGYAWPGNIRELENKVKRGVIFAGSAEIMPQDMNLDATGAPAPSSLSLADFREVFEKKFIADKIEAERWNISKVARDLDISRTTLYDLLKKYDISDKKKGS